MPTRHLAPVLLLSLCFWLLSCAVNPVTGRREISLLSEGQEAQLGAQSDQGIVAQYGLLNDAGLAAYVNDIGERMVPVSHRPDLDFTFRVLDDPVVNAFALPGGYVYITRGILTYLNDEAALAGVVGHEIGHVTARHGAQRYTQQTLFGLGVGLGAVFSETFANYAGLASQASQLLLLKYGRDDERQSDQLGVEYATKLGYDTDGMALFFQTLGRLSGGAGRLPSWASTHPDPGERYETVLGLTDQWQGQLGAGSYERKRNEFLQRLDGLVFGANPRHGFVEDDTFFHPDMRFQFPIPNGWQTQNAATQVTMVSPEQDAGVIFTLDQAATPSAAADALGQSQGVEIVSRQNVSINGQTAVRVTAYAGEGNQRQGIVSTFLSWDGNVLVFHGITSAQALNSRITTLTGPANGFATLTDPARLNKQPVVLDIVEVTSSSSFQRAAAKYPIPAGAGIDMDGLALLNGLEPSGQVRKGQFIKVLRTRSGS